MRTVGGAASSECIFMGIFGLSIASNISRILLVFIVRYIAEMDCYWFRVCLFGDKGYSVGFSAAIYSIHLCLHNYPIHFLAIISARVQSP